MWSIRKFHKVTGQATLVLALGFSLAGCNDGHYRPGPPPADTVTFPAASTQGWLQQLGTGYVPPSGSGRHNGDTAWGVATDPQGNVIVLDETYGAFSGFTSNNQPQIAVIKFDGSGNRLWIQQLGTGAGDLPNAIATDSQGNILIGGLTYGAFPGFTNTNGKAQSIVIKLNSLGRTEWVQQFPAPISSGQTAASGPSQVTSIAADAQTNVIAGGSYLDAQGDTHGYILKLSPANGAVVWNQGNGTIGTDYNVTGVAVDSQSNVVAVGGFAGTGGNASTTYMATKLDGTSGQTIWQQLPMTRAYGTQKVAYTVVAIDPQDNIFLGGLQVNAGYGQCAVAKLANSSGTQTWQQAFGAAQDCIPGGIATDTAGNVLMTGGDEYPFFQSSNPSTQDDIFLAKLNAGGTGVWLQQFGTGKDGPPGANTNNALLFVATDSQKRAYVAGTTAGAFPSFTNPNGAFEVFVTQFGP